MQRTTRKSRQVLRDDRRLEVQLIGVAATATRESGTIDLHSFSRRVSIWQHANGNPLFMADVSKAEHFLFRFSGE
jgi:hypothetical protein